MAKGHVEYIYTYGLQQTAAKFKDGIKTFNECVRDMNKETDSLLDSWEGDGKNQFETQVKLMKKKLDDISDMLYDIYDVLVESETTYIDTDESVAKQISASIQ